MKQFLLITAALAFVLSGCSKKENTLLDFQTIYYNTDSLLSVSLAEGGWWRMATPDKLVSYNFGNWVELDLAAQTLDIVPTNPALIDGYEVYHSPAFDTVVSMDIFTGEYKVVTNKGSNTIITVQLPPLNVDFGPIGIHSTHRIRRTKMFDARNALVMADYHPAGTWDQADKGINIYQIKNDHIDTITHFDILFDVSNSCEGVDLAMLSQQTGFLMVRPRRDGSFYQGNDNRERRLMKTINGGQTWQFVSQAFQPAFTLDWLLALNEQRLIAGGYAGIQISNDGGATWQNPQGYWGETVFEPQRLPDGKLVTVVYTTGLQDAFFEWPTELVVSTDDGTSWTRTGPTFYGRLLHCIDENNWVAGRGSLLQVTHDAGKTWELISAPLP